MCGFLTVGSKELEIDVFDEALGKIEGRGPDMVETSRLFDKTFGFNRLAIMDLSEKGMQPFSDNHTIVVCNGEIYNYPELKKNIIDEYTFKSSSDCEVLIPLYRKYGFYKNTFLSGLTCHGQCHIFSIMPILYANKKLS